MTEPIFTHKGVTVHARNDGYQVFVGGWRVATLKTLRGALARAKREAQAR